jgi:hypothetical protein
MSSFFYTQQAKEPVPRIAWPPQLSAIRMYPDL